MLNNRDMGNSAEGEEVYGEVRPSLWLAMPTLILGIVAALVISFFWPYIFGALSLNIAPVWPWLGVWFVCLAPGLWKVLVLMTTQYEITSQRIFYKRGVLNRHRDQIEIFRIRDLSTYRPLVQRLVGLGSVRLDTVDRSHPVLTIPGQHQADELKDWLHRLNQQERQRLGYREFESTAAL